MVLGVWISISSRRWVGVWIGLELNLLCFIPLIIQNSKGGEIRAVYFLIQACGSFVLLIRGIRLIRHSLVFKMLINIALLLKVGAAPFHLWYIWVARELGWVQFLILSTFQKVAPLILLTLREVKYLGGLIYLRIIICGVVRGAGGINSLSFRKLLVYSSINHLGWILIPIIRGSLFWFSYFCIYCLLLFITVWVLIRIRVFHLSQVTREMNLSAGRFFLFINILSLGGLPPLIGFFPKWGVFAICVERVDLICIMVIVLSRVVSIYFYIRSRLSILLLGGIEKLLGKHYVVNVSYIFTTIVNLVGFWLCLVFW